MAKRTIDQVKKRNNPSVNHNQQNALQNAGSQRLNAQVVTAFSLGVATEEEFWMKRSPIDWLPWKKQAGTEK